MHYPGERCPPPLLLPGPRFLPELLPHFPAHPELFANTCHPLSITKSPAPCRQGRPQAVAVAVSPVAWRPLCAEPCETTRLLPRREPGPRAAGAAPIPAAPRSPRGHKKRAARSLPPCAPRCPEPRRLRFPPCGLRCSSASCRGECRPREVAPSPPRCSSASCWGECRPREVAPSPPTGGYSLPLRGVTECPPCPQQGLARSFLRECLACGVAPHRCSKGYPTQELVACRSPERRLSGVKAAGEAPLIEAVAKGSRVPEGSKGKGGSAQNAGKSRCAHPRAAPRASRPAPAAAKRAGHARKSRCASKWLW